MEETVNGRNQDSVLRLFDFARGAADEEARGQLGEEEKRGREIEIEIEIDRQADRQTDRQTDRSRGRERERERERERSGTHPCEQHEEGGCLA